MFIKALFTVPSYGISLGAYHKRMAEENVVCIHNGVLFSQKEQNNVMCGKMDGTGDHGVKSNKSDSERQILHVFSCMKNLIDLKKKM
jgi:hypothetical protein